MCPPAIRFGRLSRRNTRPIQPYRHFYFFCQSRIIYYYKVLFFFFNTEVQHGIPWRVFANPAHAYRVRGVPVQQHGNTSLAGRHGRPEERRALRPVPAGLTVRRTARLPTGRRPAAAQGAGRRGDGVRPAKRIFVPDFLSRIHTEVRTITHSTTP